MIEKDDWRLTSGPVLGMEDQLRGIPLYCIPFEPLSERWDHEHCIFCWAKFCRHPEYLQEGYCTRPENSREADWICPKCYEDFKEMFVWTVEPREEKNMIDQYLAQYEGKELELFRNYGNPYETISIRVQIDEGCMYLGDDEMEHGPDYGRSLKIYTFDRENTRKAFELLHGGIHDPVQVLKGMLNEQHRTRTFIDLCKKNNITFDAKFYM